MSEWVWISEEKWFCVCCYLIYCCTVFIVWNVLRHYAKTVWFCSLTGEDEEQEQAGPTVAGNNQRVCNAGGREDQRRSAGVALDHSEKMGSFPQEFHIGMQACAGFAPATSTSAGLRLSLYSHLGFLSLHGLDIS